MSLKQLCVLFVLACTSSIPGVTSAADLSVGGHIRMDGACSITLGNGGIFDFGNVSLTEIDQDSYSNSRDVPLTINCPSQTRIGVKAIDNRKESAAASRGFGVGNPAIGGYGIDPERNISEADGRKVYVIHRSGDYWYRTDDPTRWPSTTISWTANGLGPVAFRTMTTTLGVNVYLHDIRENMAHVDVLEIDGSATLELVYL
ncbi:DUF1120 domain-containing protein [Burkholderia contaminans]|uniref:DUF1120 domain-containing protein n=1 Tax=Burkholderia contaminans TaxID=488447 RepID=A0ABD7YCV0_9BURK|nr:DUF1120 domain-containing protein [Burkholderia contaminans]MBY4818923.1 DUF1120 domain-containing protein [Burkholderia contaminans]MBY4824013.1 DUF1120 domain-containing protein [Burkholderia contaminans]MBY4854912.1 DUF1120 domain-containing protein [Burkholderia contaminans]MBY4884816.1 DUF1120 domain-containing protein [Burkholderia contaminans]MCA7912703.1 DUF1120 domain-containing protein [Burkholderia contaminans]